MRFSPLASVKKIPEGIRDVAAAAGLVLLLVGGVFLYSGGAWPPMVIVESGSMMHVTPEGDRAADVPYGRIGTIDPGDIHFIRAVDHREDVELWVEGGTSRFGRPGDVIAYRPGGDEEATPIIHRVMTWVEVRGAEDTRSYEVAWLDGEMLTFGSEGIYLPELGFDEEAGYTPEDGYKPPFSGFITKGDNVATNERADQAIERPDLGPVDPVPVEWVVGKARGEVPWVGLLRLVFLDGRVNQPNPAWTRIGNAFAPIDLWTMLGLCLATMVTVPLSVDVWKAWRDRREAEEDLRRGEREKKPKKPRRDTTLPPPGREPGKVAILEVVDGGSK